MRRLVALAALAASVLAVTAAAGRSGTGDGRIVFPANPQGSTLTQLFSISPDGTGLKQLTKDGVTSYDPVFSPAGTRIAYIRFGYGIYTMRPDGSGVKRLTTGARDANPTWSPDGKRIAFVRPQGPAWRLWTVPAAGGKPKKVGLTPPAGRPSWVKAGLLVPTGGDLISVNPDTGRVLRYFEANIDAIWGQNSVTVSPTGKWLTYIGSRDPVSGDMECGDGPCQRYGLYLESLTAKKKIGKLIVKDTGAATFSPDGKRLAFVTGGQLYVGAVGSTARTPIATPGLMPVTTGPPAWR